MSLGSFHEEYGNLEEALTNYETCASYRRQLFGERHPEVARCLHGAASIYRRTGKGSNADSLYEEALSIYKENPPTDELHTRELVEEFFAFLNENGADARASELYKEYASLDLPQAD